MHVSRMFTVHCSGRPWGVSACQGECLPAGGGGICLPRGVVCLPGGACLQDPLDRMTDACKNITLPQLRCGR